MPTYVYKFVKTGETIEVAQAFTDPALTEAKHPRTGRRMAVKKVFTPVGVTFKGTGFYKTDSRGSSSSAKPARDGESTAGAPEQKADTAKPEKKAEPTPARPSRSDAAPSSNAAAKSST